MQASFHYHVLKVFINTSIFVGKPKGSKMTLPVFLHKNGKNLRAEYGNLSDDAKGTILAEYQAKVKEDNMIKNRSNKSISKSVDSSVNVITTLVCSLLLSS